MKQYLNITMAVLLLFTLGTSTVAEVQKGCNLSVKVTNLRNSTGNVQFALYNRADAFPDEQYKKQYKIVKGKIENRTSKVVFEDLPPGKYAVNILHDENKDGKIQKGIILPIEGIGFSNYTTIGLSNRPSFEKASFHLSVDKEINVVVVYF